MSVSVSGNSTVRLHRLTMVAEGDGVMVGRPDVGSYAVFPEEGAQALRLLDEGRSVAEVATWYECASGETLDLQDFLEVLEELQFILVDGEQRPVAGSVRWRRLGRVVFSWPAWLVYGACLTAAVVAMVATPELRPTYEAVFFTDHISLIPVLLLILGIPGMLVHESFHALAGRRLGLKSSFGIGRRLYFLVAETRLSSLLSVPRRMRYLPFLAGIVADLVMISTLTLLALILRTAGSPHWCWALCVAVAFGVVLRLIWQLQFYLETDLYYVTSTALRCTDLQNATRHQIRSWIRRLMRRPPLRQDDGWSEHDLKVALWYAPLLIAGYGFALGTLVLVGIPTALQFWTTVVNRLTQPDVSATEIIDALISASLTTTQLGLLLYVTIRDWHAKQSVIRKKRAKED